MGPEGIRDTKERSLQIGGMGAEEHKILSGVEGSNSFGDFSFIRSCGVRPMQGVKLKFLLTKIWKPGTKLVVRVHIKEMHK